MYIYKYTHNIPKMCSVDNETKLCRSISMCCFFLVFLFCFVFKISGVNRSWLINSSMGYFSCVVSLYSQHSFVSQHTIYVSWDF